MIMYDGIILKEESEVLSVVKSQKSSVLRSILRFPLKEPEFCTV